VKVLKITLISFTILLFVLFAGVWFFLFTLDIKQYIPQLTEAVTKSTGRQLTVGDARLNFAFFNLRLELKDVSLSDNPLFEEKTFMVVPKVFLSVDMGKTILARKIIISEIGIFSPELTIIRLKDGRINAASTGGVSVAGSESVNSVQPLAVTSKAASTAALPLLIVRTIVVQDAVVHLVDRTFEPAVEIDISRIFLSVNNFSLTDPFEIVLSAALFSAEPNLDMRGRAKLEVAASGVELEALKMSLAVSRVNAGQLNNSLAMIKPAGFKKGEGSITIDVRKAVVSAGKLEFLDAELSADITAVILSGENILAAGLKSLSMFPGLMDSVISSLPPDTQSDISNGITLVDRLNVVAQINKDQLSLKTAELTTRDVSASAVGVIQVNGMLDMRSNVFIAPKLSDIVIAKVSDLNVLKDDQGRIDMPFLVKGNITSPKVSPDVGLLTKKLLMGKGLQEFDKILDDPAVGKAINKVFNFLKK